MIPLAYLFKDAASQLGDPNMSRIRTDEWLGHYNMSARELCQKANVLKYRATFDLQQDSMYSYPAEMTVMTALEATDTPDDEDSFREVKEKFEDEFRSLTRGHYPQDSVPRFYFADVGWFYLIGKPAAEVVRGGRITYFGLPDRVFDAANGTMQLPDLAQDYIVRRMVVYGMLTLHREQEASTMLKLWYEDVEGLQDKMTDRSEDRRSSIRQVANPFAGQR